jgi:hypothetical protein
MKRPFRLLLVGFFWFLVPGLALAAEPSAEQILERIDALYRGSSTTGRMRVTLLNEQRTRELVAQFWCKGRDQTRIRLISANGEPWTAAPRPGRRLSERQRQADSAEQSVHALLGGWRMNGTSHGGHRLSGQYRSEIGFRGLHEGQSVLVVSCQPRRETPEAWDKLDVTVRRRDLLPVRVRCYGADGSLRRTLTFSEPRTLGGRKLPTRVTMTTAASPEQRTEAVLEHIEFDVRIADRIFTSLATRV